MPLFKPSAKKVVETIFSEFTPEEKEILNSNIFPFPYMYNTLIRGVCPIYKSKYSLFEAKSMARACIYPCRKDLKNPEIRKKFFSIFIHDLLTITSKQNLNPLPVKDTVKSIFSFVKKLSPQSLQSLEDSFYTYLLDNNLQPFTNDKDIFLNQVESVILTWSKDVEKDKLSLQKEELVSKVLFPFIEDELKIFFTPILYVDIHNYISKHLGFMSIFIHTILAIIQVVICNK